MKRAKLTDMIQEEYRDSDGYWIYLKPGYMCGDDPGTHGIIEDTKRAARSRLASVVPCNCADCQAQPGYVKRGK
jgi:hypothetical protein